jgi:transposase-like protein
MKAKDSQVRYSEEFKRMVVSEIESGVMTANRAAKYYGIGGNLTIYRWLATYGMNSSKGKKVIIMTKQEETELITLRKEVALLKRELEEAEFRAIAWESMVEAIEIDLGIPVKKKPWSQALLDAKKKLYQGVEDSESTATAASSDSQSKPSTKNLRTIKRK